MNPARRIVSTFCSWVKLAGHGLVIQVDGLNHRRENLEAVLRFEGVGRIQPLCQQELHSLN